MSFLSRMRAPGRSVIAGAIVLILVLPLDENKNDAVIAARLFPSAVKQIPSDKRMPDFN